MLYLLVISIAIFILTMIAMEINKRKLNEDQLRIFKQATFQNTWRLYVFIFVGSFLGSAFGKNLAVWAPFPVIFFVAFLVFWTLFVKRRIARSGLPKSFVKTDTILSGVMLTILCGFILWLTFFDETR